MTSQKMDNGQPQTPLRRTPDGGMSPGKLRQKVSVVMQRSMDTKLMGELGKAKVGTLKMEVRALELTNEAQKGGNEGGEHFEK